MRPPPAPPAAGLVHVAASPGNEAYYGLVKDGGLWRFADEESVAKNGWTIAQAAPVTPRDVARRAAERRATADIGRAPIVDRQNGLLVGLVARRDLLRVRAQAARQEQERDRALRLLG